MKNFLLSKKQSIAVAASGLVSVLMVAGIVYSATTISTNVNTGGTLTVSGTSALTGNVFASSTLQSTGNALLYAITGIATTSPSSLVNLAVHGNTLISGNITSVANVTATGTLTVSGLSTLSGFVSSASSSVGANFSVAGPLSASSTLTVSGASSLKGNVDVNGNATTTASSGQFATQGFVGAGGTSTPSVELSALGTGTTTLYMHSSGSNKGSCIELRQPHTGNEFRIYIGSPSQHTGATTTGSALVVESGSCK